GGGGGPELCAGGGRPQRVHRHCAAYRHHQIHAAAHGRQQRDDADLHPRDPQPLGAKRRLSCTAAPAARTPLPWLFCRDGGVLCALEYTQKPPAAGQDPAAGGSLWNVRETYFSSTLAPSSSSFFWMSSASALEACSFSLAFGVSTSFLASIRETPVSSLTVLMTCILEAPTSARMTSNSVFSSSAGAAAAPAAAGAAAATAETPNSSQMVSTSSLSSRTVIVVTDSTMAVIFSEAMIVTSITVCF